MVNVKDQVYQSIRGLTENVSDGFPSAETSFPAIQYSEEDNSVYEWCDGQESKSNVRFRIDIWNDRSTSDLAVRVDQEISKLGLRRSACWDLNDPGGLKHKVMRYQGILDIGTGIVHN